MKNILAFIMFIPLWSTFTLGRVMSFLSVILMEEFEIVYKTGEVK